MKVIVIKYLSTIYFQCWSIAWGRYYSLLFNFGYKCNTFSLNANKIVNFVQFIFCKTISWYNGVYVHAWLIHDSGGFLILLKLTLDKNCQFHIMYEQLQIAVDSRVNLVLKSRFLISIFVCIFRQCGSNFLRLVICILFVSAIFGFG